MNAPPKRLPTTAPAAAGAEFWSAAAAGGAADRDGDIEGEAVGDADAGGTPHAYLLRAVI